MVLSHENDKILEEIANKIKVPENGIMEYVEKMEDKINKLQHRLKTLNQLIDANKTIIIY